MALCFDGNLCWGRSQLLVFLRGSGWLSHLVDSNARAIECARHNIEANGLSNVETVLTHAYTTPEPSFGVVVGNPPYYAGRRIAQSFLNIAQKALDPGGTAYLVSKHGAELAACASEAGLAVEARRRRGYDITAARKTAL